MKMKHVVGALVICMMAATAAQATTYARYTGTVRHYEVVGIPGYSGVLAGTYVLEVKEGQGGTVQSYDSFCVDVVDPAETAFSVYTTLQLENAPITSSGDITMGTTRADDIRKLFGLMGNLPINLNTAGMAAAFQAAVWEIIKETTTGNYYLDTGNWQTTGLTQMVTANGWLALINADSGNTMFKDTTVNVLASSNYQDYAIVGGYIPPVPEPLTMASAFFAIAGLGGYIRRRTGRAAA